MRQNLVDIHFAAEAVADIERALEETGTRSGIDRGVQPRGGPLAICGDAIMNRLKGASSLSIAPRINLVCRRIGISGKTDWLQKCGQGMRPRPRILRSFIKPFEVTLVTANSATKPAIPRTPNRAMSVTGIIHTLRLPLANPRSSRGFSAAGIIGSVQAAMVTAKNAMINALLG